MRNSVRQTLTAFALLAVISPALRAQQDRLTQSIDNQRRVTLRGNLHPMALAQYDRGPVSPDMKINLITLALKRADAQQQALDRLLAEEQDRSSPNYHKWLSPEEFADRFGISQNDVAKVAAWLNSEGFHIQDIARGRMWIVFSGTAAQVEAAFHTEIHRYEVNGETHFAIASEPSVPEALAPLVMGFRGLDDFRLHPAHSKKAVPRDGKHPPGITFNDGVHALAPDDLATIYDFATLYNTGIDGTGQSIVVIGQTAIVMDDIRSFRSLFNLPANDPVLKLYGPDPGISQNDFEEADLDIEFAGGVARRAKLYYVYSQDVDVSVQYAVDQNFAPVITESYGGCEAKQSGTSTPFLRGVAQQANAEGITWLASTGDTGAADCDYGANVAQYGLGINFPSSIPEVTAVGGTEFNGPPGVDFWSNSNDASGGSALSYIPETSWNDTATRGSLSSSGGGVSVLFGKPSWQTGPGVPNDNARDIPDVSLSASADHDPYEIVSGGSRKLIGGTSASTPAFAGIITMLNQYLVTQGIQAKPGLGNINPTIYRLAQTTNNVFHDVTDGDNIVPCNIGTTDCNGGTLGYAAGPGYDLVTGWGSIDANNLFQQWNSSTMTTSTTVIANPSSLSLNSSTQLKATVTPSAGSNAVPSGTVTFGTGGVSLGTASLSPSGGAAIASLTVYGSQLAMGSNTITAYYGGSSTFNSSAGSVIVNISAPVNASAVVPTVIPNPVYKEQTDSDGYSWFYEIRLDEVAGVSTTLTGFSIDGTDHTADIISFFGSASIAAFGSLSADLRAKGLAVPTTRVFLFSGMDSSGQAWSQQLEVPFYGRQLSASVFLTGAPDVVRQIPGADPSCQWQQELNLQEVNGFEVHLTRFIAGDTDLSDQISEFFGTARLAPFGSMSSSICWSDLSVPGAQTYQIAGIDSGGNKVFADVSSQFLGPSQNPTSLSVSQDVVELDLADSTQSRSVTLNVDPGSQTEQWSVSLFPSNRTTSWLQVSPLSGTGPGQVNLTATGAGLADGAYLATLIFQAADTSTQVFNVAVLLTIGLSDSISIGGIANGASGALGYAPGMVMSVYGTNLAPRPQLAGSLPLPFNMQGVTATVNNIPAPLYYVGQNQVNLQIPYETPAGNAIVSVNNNGRIAAYAFLVDPSAPGIFVGQGSAIVPNPSGKRGKILTLFITGEGDVSPPLATGATPPANTKVTQLPQPLLPVSMTIGGVPATIEFIGVPNGLAGITQINFQVPSNAPKGLQPVVVTVGGVASVAANFTVQ